MYGISMAKVMGSGSIWLGTKEPVISLPRSKQLYWSISLLRFLKATLTGYLGKLGGRLSAISCPEVSVLVSYAVVQLTPRSVSLPSLMVLAFSHDLTARSPDAQILVSFSRTSSMRGRAAGSSSQQAVIKVQNLSVFTSSALVLGLLGRSPRWVTAKMIAGPK
jgi:hypothetical protein